jgi:membrane-bound ClpP family serine protease
MRLLGIVRHFQSPAGIYAAAALRIILGVVLFLAAPTSRAPEVVRILGIIILVAGLITPLFGLERFRRLLDWWSARGPAFMRVWAGFALAFGLLLAYTVVP